MKWGNNGVCRIGVYLFDGGREAVSALLFCLGGQQVIGAALHVLAESLWSIWALGTANLVPIQSSVSQRCLCRLSLASVTNGKYR